MGEKHILKGDDMNNKSIIGDKIKTVQTSKDELLIQIKFEQGRNKKRKLKDQLSFKDGILTGLKWAFENVK